MSERDAAYDIQALTWQSPLQQRGTLKFAKKNWTREEPENFGLIRGELRVFFHI